MPSDRNGKNAISAYVDDKTLAFIHRCQKTLEADRDMPVSMSITIGHIINKARPHIEAAE